MKLRNILFSLAGGLLATMAFPNPVFYKLQWQGGFLAFVCLVPLLMVRSPQRPWSAWRLGFVFGMVYLGGAILWMAGMKSMHPLGPLAWLILSAYLACYPALFLWAYHKLLARRISVWIAAPMLWIVLEYVRDYLISGFPWVALGYAHYQNPFMLAVAPVTGVWGLSWITVLVNVGVYKILVKIFPKIAGEDTVRGTPPVDRRQGWLRQSGLLLMLLLLMGGVLYEKKAYDQEQLKVSEYSVAALQGNIDQNQPWDQAYQKKTLEVYAKLTADAKQAGAELSVWPETAFPGIFSLDQQLSLIIRDWSRRFQMAQLVGTDEVEKSSGKEYLYFNTLLLIDAQGNHRGQTAKRHLVPFGEYVPMKDSLLFFVHKVVRRYGGAGWTPGRERKVLKLGKGVVGGLICFESIFSRYGRELVKKGSNLLVVISNDTWFGKTAAPAQHTSFSVLRAAETSRYLVRAATTGYSCIISPRGRILTALPIDQAGQITSTVRLLHHQTLFVRYGNWLCWICGFVLFLEIFLPLAILKTRRRFGWE
ncbi:apolipoprotein N-acyltransferase [bacterium]|nr:apolipoprotein N-acyltransferase [bacterium]